MLILDLRSGAGAAGGVEDVDVSQVGRHTQTTVDYEQSPPAGGEHNPVWQNAGFYEEPITNETAVHTLEPGAAIPMARAIAKKSDVPAVDLFVVKVAASQKVEVKNMQEMLKDMGAPPVEDKPSMKGMDMGGGHGG